MAFTGQYLSVGGTGSFYDLTDSAYTLFSTMTTKWTLSDSTGSSGARTCLEISGPPLVAGMGDTRILLAGTPAGASPVMESPDTFLTGGLHCLLSPEGGKEVLGAWDSGSNPYGTLRKIGFTRCSAAATDFNEILVCESDYSLFLGIRTAANSYYGCYAGAIFKSPATNDNETTAGRNFGIITSSSTAISTTFGANSGAFTDHVASIGTSHAYMLAPDVATVWAIIRRSLMRVEASTDNTQHNNRQYEPLTFQRSASPYWPVGELENVKLGKMQWRTEAKDQWLAFGASVTTNVDALMFKMT